MVDSFHFYCIYHLINMKSSLTLLCLVVWVNVDASSAQTEYCGKPEGAGRRMQLIPDRERYENGDQIEYGCLATCNNGEWDKTIKCKDYCSKPEGADTRMLLIPDRERYENGDQIDYGCLSGPNQGSRGKATCKNGEWSQTIECQVITCDDPRDPLVSSPYRWQRGQLGNTQRYSCKTGFKITNARGVATCTSDGSWTPHTLCEEITCDKPDIPNAVIEDPKTRYKYNEQLTYECKRNYELLDSTTRPAATCTTNGWTRTLGCKASCPDPPRVINGDYTKEKRDVEGVITEVSYQCSRQYKPSFEHSIRCLNGEWETPPKCLRPCQIFKFDAEYHLQDLPQIMYMTHGEKKTLQCKKEYYHEYKRLAFSYKNVIEVLCDDGDIHYGEHIPICSHLY